MSECPISESVCSCYILLQPAQKQFDLSGLISKNICNVLKLQQTVLNYQNMKKPQQNQNAFLTYSQREIYLIYDLSKEGKNLKCFVILALEKIFF
jgi:hypothetical protein